MVRYGSYLPWVMVYTGASVVWENLTCGIPVCNPKGCKTLMAGVKTVPWKVDMAPREVDTAPQAVNTVPQEVDTGGGHSPAGGGHGPAGGGLGPAGGGHGTDHCSIDWDGKIKKIFM